MAGNALVPDVANSNPLIASGSRYSPVGPANYYNPFPTTLDFDPAYQGVPGADMTSPVFSDKQAALEGLWMRRENAHAMWQIAVKGQYPLDAQKRHFQAFQDADTAWLRGQINPAINPLAAQDDRWDAIDLGKGPSDADVIQRAIQARQRGK